MEISNKNVTGAEQKSLIDFILEEKAKQKESERKAKEEAIPLMNEDNFFITVENENGFITVEDFKKHLIAIDDVDLPSIEQFFKDIKDKKKLIIPAFPVTDKKGVKYYWISTDTRTVSKGYKLKFFAGLDAIITAYEFNMYRFDLSIDKLYHKFVKDTDSNTEQ